MISFHDHKVKLDFLHEQTSKIVIAYVAHNALPPPSVPEVIGCVYAALVDLNQPMLIEEAAATTKTKTEIAASCRHEALISFIDGRPYQTLKRHLTAHGLTPETYRGRFGLPSNYPMVAPAYADRRSRIAKQIRLGHRA